MLRALSILCCIAAYLDLILLSWLTSIWGMSGRGHLEPTHAVGTRELVNDPKNAYLYHSTASGDQGVAMPTSLPLVLLGALVQSRA